jgi:hypothetical protein
VIDPELDIWMWGSDNAMAQVLQWDHQIRIRDYVVSKGYRLTGDGKPDRPKEAMQDILRFLSLPMSASIYGGIAMKISLSKCTDQAFNRMRQKLVQWFPPANL